MTELTKEELKFAINKCKSYPAGVDWQSWGCGPMKKLTDPSAYSEETLKEHG